jgi:hypothetical protein
VIFPRRAARPTTIRRKATAAQRAGLHEGLHELSIRSTAGG